MCRSIRAPGLEEATRDFKDFGTVDEIHMSGGAFEINSIPTFNSSGLKPGSTALRLPKMAMPLVDGAKRTFCHESLSFAKTGSGQTQRKLKKPDLHSLCFFSSAGRTVLFMGNRVFSKAEVYDPLEKALEVPTPAHNPEA